MREKLENPAPHTAKHLSTADREIVNWIKAMVDERNLNNVTRTKAYLNFYMLRPEIHWAFLGHMVSRNGGWNMTDLKGDLISRLLNKTRQKEFFSFLERGNWLIFQDAFPQFLLYEESIRSGRNLFYLLPCFGVSKFMEVIWNDFWIRKDSYVLAMAQIVNEQSYLEERIIKNPVYQEKVLHTLEFALQDILSFSHILFPFKENGNQLTEVIGLNLHQFGSLHERIMLRKNLYNLLFNDPIRYHRILAWSNFQPHTGSRKDYWPQLFNDVNEGLPGPLQLKRLRRCRLIKGAPRFYSPKLENAWPNLKQEQAEPGDWFNDTNVVGYLQKQEESLSGEIAGDYCETLHNLELAVLAKKAFFL